MGPETGIALIQAILIRPNAPVSRVVILASTELATQSTTISQNLDPYEVLLMCVMYEDQRPFKADLLLHDSNIGSITCGSFSPIGSSSSCVNRKMVPLTVPYLG